MQVTSAGPSSTAAQPRLKTQGKSALYCITNKFILTNLIYVQPTPLKLANGVVRQLKHQPWVTQGPCQDRFFTDLISTRGLGVRGWPSGKTEMLRSVVALPE